MKTNCRIIKGDAATCISSLEAGSVSLVVTSPPYFGHRDYGVEGQIGCESHLSSYLERIREVLVELHRVVDTQGSCFIVIGDTYRNRRLLLVPHRIALLADEIGWVVRNDLIWHKLDPPPESPRNRWRTGHEHVLFLSKNASGYRFDADAIRVPYAEATLRRWGKGQNYGGAKSAGRKNERDSRMRHGQSFSLNPKGCIPTDVWSMASGSSSAGHYATFPEALVKTMIEACSEVDEIVLDPFAGTGTTCRVAVDLGRRAIGIELNEDFADMATKLLARDTIELQIHADK